MTLTAFAAAWFVHLLAAASPGPAILMAARTGVTEGLRTGVFLAIGIGAGALVWAIAALFGLSLLFQTAPALLWGFKIIGGVFLCWIAFQMWKHAAEPLDLDRDHGRPPRTAISAFRLGLTTQLANPKPAVFFGAVFVGTVPPGTSPLMMGLLLLVVFLNEVFCATVVARAFSFEAPRRAYARLKTGIDRTFGGILALLGVKITAT
jgi:threonine/homoserine/homoserine lactone efflux protein